MTSGLALLTALCLLLLSHLFILHILQCSPRCCLLQVAFWALVPLTGEASFMAMLLSWQSGLPSVYWVPSHTDLTDHLGVVDDELLKGWVSVPPPPPPLSTHVVQNPAHYQCSENVCLKLWNSKTIKPVNPKGNQPWIFMGRTDAETEALLLWPPDAKSRLFGKYPDPRKDWWQEEKGETEDEMVGWHHELNGHELEQTPV